MLLYTEIDDNYTRKKIGRKISICTFPICTFDSLIFYRLLWVLGCFHNRYFTPISCIFNRTECIFNREFTEQALYADMKYISFSDIRDDYLSDQNSPNTFMKYNC